MKIFIIAALSADGFIARDQDEPSTMWTSKEDKKHFIETTKKCGVIIMGSKTFQTIGKALPGRRNIVYSNSPINIPDIETTFLPPEELINKLIKEGLTEVAVCGGSTIYTMFMKAGLIDELYLTIEPVVFGQGLPLFKEKINAKLSLLSEEKINNSVFLRFKVEK